VIYLSYTCIDLIDFAKDFSFPTDPIKWDHHERFLKQCELDAIYAHLYNLEKEEMDYIMDAFPIVKRKDIAKYGSYRTKETILRMYDEFSWVKDELNQTRQNN
jgi:hypothetical protein